MQQTLILLKPDCLEKKVAGQVIGRFEEKGYEIKASKMLLLDDDLLREHYAHVAELPFFPEIASFMSSRAFVTCWVRLIQMQHLQVPFVEIWVRIR